MKKIMETPEERGWNLFRRIAGARAVNSALRYGHIRVPSRTKKGHVYIVRVHYIDLEVNGRRKGTWCIFPAHEVVPTKDPPFRHYEPYPISDHLLTLWCLARYDESVIRKVGAWGAG